MTTKITVDLALLDQVLDCCQPEVNNERQMLAYDALRAALTAEQPRPVTPYTCPKCHALWLHWPKEQSGFDQDHLNVKSAKWCEYCEAAGVNQLDRLERVPAALTADVVEPVTVFYRCNECKHAYEDQAPSSCDCGSHTFSRVNYYAAPQPAPSPAVEFSQFLTDVETAAGLLSHGKTDKALADRISDAAFRLRTAPQPAQQPVLLDEIERLKNDASEWKNALESLKMDAMRYHWLKVNHQVWSWAPSQYNRDIVSGFACNGTGYSGFNFEDALDRAMGMK